MIIETKYIDQDLQDENILQVIKKQANENGIKDFFICYNDMPCIYDNGRIIQLPCDGIARSCFSKIICISENGEPVTLENIKNLLYSSYQKANEIRNKKVFILSKDDDIWNHLDYIEYKRKIEHLNKKK